jgi:hypothetical protein
MFIAFIPMFAIWEIANLFGENKLFELFFERGGTPGTGLPNMTRAASLRQVGAALLSRFPALVAGYTTRNPSASIFTSFRDKGKRAGRQALIQGEVLSWLMTPSLNQLLSFGK